MMTWQQYKHRNILGADCQVITAVNAYQFLTGKVINEDRQELCKLAKACFGSAICIEKVHEKLGLETFDYTKSYYDALTESDEIEYPIEMSVWHPKCGFHSTLIVERDLRCHAIRVLNFRWGTTGDGWLWEENLNFFVNDMNKGWAFRKFRLKGNR